MYHYPIENVARFTAILCKREVAIVLLVSLTETNSLQLKELPNFRNVTEQNLSNTYITFAYSSDLISILPLHFMILKSLENTLEFSKQILDSGSKKLKYNSKTGEICKKFFKVIVLLGVNYG